MDKNEHFSFNGEKIERGKTMDEWMVFLVKDGEEIKHHRFHALTPEEALTKSEEFAKAEWEERQREFPFTPEFPADVVLFQLFHKWQYVKK